MASRTCVAHVEVDVLKEEEGTLHSVSGTEAREAGAKSMGSSSPRMGGVVSAGAVAFGQPPARQGEVASAMLRGSIVGGLALFCINTIRSARANCIEGEGAAALAFHACCALADLPALPSCSAWSCQRWALRLQNGDLFVAGDTDIAHAVECLQGFCYYDNLAWAGAACVTAVLGSVASVLRSRALARLFFLTFAARGVHCVGTLAWALRDGTSCPFWSLTKAYWLPMITLAHVVVFCALSWKFSGIDFALPDNGEGVPFGLLSEFDWERAGECERERADSEGSSEISPDLLPMDSRALTGAFGTRARSSRGPAI